MDRGVSPSTLPHHLDHQRLTTVPSAITLAGRRRGRVLTLSALSALGLALLLACSGKTHVTVPNPNTDTPDAGGNTGPLPGCENEDGSTVPATLWCTGLYADIANKELARGVREYAPATPLWSDGAEKHRWIYLPPGTTIDTTSRTEWVFPVGTKLWKEFSVGGRRIETRLFQKVRSDRWLNTAYAWSSDELTADISYGADLDVDGVPYHIPTAGECSDCHKGRLDRILGFEEISLGTPGAAGVTLATLIDEGLLTVPPPAAEFSIPDDGTGAATPALAWLHINCGVTCHNENPQATGNGTGLRLRLDPSTFDVLAPGEWDSFRTTLNVDAITPRWDGERRVVPGEPDRSLLLRLISSRGDEQMPPIATRVADPNAMEWVAEWIRRMPPNAAAHPAAPSTK